MRWSRIAISSVLFALLAAAVVLAIPVAHWVKASRRAEEDRPNPLVATPKETREILVALVEHAQFVGIPPPPPEPGEEAPPERRRMLLLSDQSVCFAQDPAHLCSTEIAERFTDTELSTLAPLKLRQELVVANRTRHQLHVSGIGNTKVIASSEIQRLFKNGWWEDFYRSHPGTAGYVEISQPVLSPNRDKALVYLAHHCDGLCGTGTVYLLARQAAAWHVVKEEMLWIS